MGIFFGRGKANERTKEYDHEKLIPVINTSICFGEQMIGFRDRETGKLKDMMLIHDHKDIEAFCREYGIKEEEIQKQW